MPPKSRPLVAHLTCRAITVKGNYCRKCGRALAEHNTAAVDDRGLPNELVEHILSEAGIANYDDLSEVPLLVKQ